MTIHLVVGTPMYGGVCHDTYARSVNQLGRIVKDAGFGFSTLSLGNESLIGRARDTIAWQFLSRFDTTHLLFVDSDIGFRADDVMRMVHADKPVIIAPVPLKTIDWERVHFAARAGVMPMHLARSGGVFNIVPEEDEEPTADSPWPDAPFKLKRGGAALMLITRRVFAALSPSRYLSNNPGSAVPPGSLVQHFFPTYVEDDELKSEDYGFCELCREAGVEIWCAPWCEVTHTGAYQFSGVYSDCKRVSEAISETRDRTVEGQSPVSTGLAGRGAAV